VRPEPAVTTDPVPDPAELARVMQAAALQWQTEVQTLVALIHGIPQPQDEPPATEAEIEQGFDNMPV